MTAKEQTRMLYELHGSFPVLTKEELDLVVANTFEISYKAGDIIFKEHSLTSHLLYIRDGLVKIVRENNNKQTIIVRIIPANNFVGLMSLLGNRVYNFTAIAIEPTTILTIHNDTFNHVMIANSGFSYNMLQQLSQYGLEIINHLINIHQKLLPGRVADVLLFFMKLNNSTEFSLPLTRKEMAEFAGTTKESFIRALSEFKSDRIIELVENKRVVIKSVEILERLSRLG